MPIADLLIDGGCRCGRVRFRLSKAPGSAFSITIIMPSDGNQL